MVIANNAVLNKERGRMNGIFMTSGCFTRAIAPLFFGFSFAKTVENDWYFPFNYAFSFYVMAFWAATASYVSKGVPSFLNKPIGVAGDLKYTQMSKINKT